MFGFATKKLDTTFGPQYAVFNLSKIGLRYFRIGIQASSHSRDRLVAHAAAHPNAGWVFSAEGWFNIAIGFWARDNAEINDISAQIRATLTPQDKIVFQSELTTLWSFGNRPYKQGVPMCIVDSVMDPLELSPLETDYIKLVALDSSLSDKETAEILNTKPARVARLKNDLTERGVLVGYQERISYGRSHYKVFVDTLSRKSPHAAEDLTKKVWADEQCIYFERANGKYDLEFEMVADSKSQVKEFVSDFADYQIVILTQNLYTNLFPVNKTANLKEIQDAFAKQEGVIDLRTSKLWYLSHQGAEAYLDINENRKYFEAMTKSELDLFGEVAIYFKQQFPQDKFNVIDIGSGNGLKGRIFIEKLGEKNVKAYFPLDIQPIELAVALRAHEKGEYAKHPTLLDIENMGARFPLKLVPGERQAYLFFGGTYGNFPAASINEHLKKILTDTSVLLVAMPVLRDQKSDEEILDSYTTEQMEAVSFALLSQLGFVKSSFVPHNKELGLIVRPVLEDNRLVTTYELKEPVMLHDKKFEPGTIFKVTTSWKPTFEQFKETIEGDFKAEFVRNKEFAIAIIKQ